MTLGELWKIYAAAKKDVLRGWKRAEQHWAHLNRLIGSDRDIAAITLDDVDAYMQKRRLETTQMGNPAMAATRNREVARLRAMLRFAVVRRKLAADPLAGVTKEREDNVRQTWLNEKALAALMACCPWWLRAMVVLAFDTGMRAAEVRLLRWDQFECGGDAILINPKNTKTGHGRRIPLTSRAKATIDELPSFGERGDFVFVNPMTGRQFEKSGFNEAFQMARKRSGVRGSCGEQVRFHDLRRSFVTNARRRGISETVIMKMTGHRTRSVFERYNICDPAELDAAVRAIEAASIKEREASGLPLTTASRPVPFFMQAAIDKAVAVALAALRAEQSGAAGGAAEGRPE